MTEIRYTVRQIVQKVGRKRIQRLLKVGRHATAKWGVRGGIPRQHWPTLIENVDWITLDILLDTEAIETRRLKRAA